MPNYISKENKNLYENIRPSTLQYVSFNTIKVYGESLNPYFSKVHISLKLFQTFWKWSRTVFFRARNELPWIPEPSTVNNKLKRREGSGSTGRFFD